MYLYASMMVENYIIESRETEKISGGTERIKKEEEELRKERKQKAARNAKEIEEKGRRSCNEEY